MGADCELSGVCGVLPEVGAYYSVLVGAQRGKGLPRGAQGHTPLQKPRSWSAVMPLAMPTGAAARPVATMPSMTPWGSRLNGRRSQHNACPRKHGL
jgi:hypothetical protein